MKKLILILIALFGFFSCGEKEIEKPKDLIGKDQMAELIFDMHIANKTRNLRNIEDQKNINYHSIVSEKYNIDSTRFKRSHEYYMHHLDQYEAIYKVVVSRLDTLLKKQEIIVKELDSIKKLNEKKERKREKPKSK